MITAVGLAKKYGISAKWLRANLRKAGLSWHTHNAPWEAEVGSLRAQQMESVAASLGRK
jgi:hypothetical protein